MTSATAHPAKHSEPVLQAAAEPWWRDSALVTDTWMGVFKGGGAAGVAYGGALEAVLEHKRWFSAVAGSSAGAITATLIAAGLDPSEIKSLTPHLLDGVQPNRLLVALGMGVPIYSMARVTYALRQCLRKQVGLLTGTHRDEGDVTFAELHTATEIDLYVVVMDLATSQPVVLSRYTTPECDVANAVAASSAIPVAFESGRSCERGSGSRCIGSWMVAPGRTIHSSYSRTHRSDDIGTCPTSPTTNQSSGSCSTAVESARMTCRGWFVRIWRPRTLRIPASS
jgi:predicted acylesterase/phospholipase RssA